MNRTRILPALEHFAFLEDGTAAANGVHKFDATADVDPRHDLRVVEYFNKVKIWAGWYMFKNSKNSTEDGTRKDKWTKCRLITQGFISANGFIKA